MFSPLASRSLTRWVSDGDIAIEVAHLQKVMWRIQSALHDVPNSERSYIANALLNVAVATMIKEEGRPRASALLMRLGDAVGSCATPEPEAPMDLSRTDS
jgi:hypothetical protein